MATMREGAQARGPALPVAMRAFVRGPLAAAPQFVRTMEGGEVCRLVVLGEARGPASSPPRVSLYIRNGDGEAEGLRSDEARRCARGLQLGDVIEAIGDIGPLRPRAAGQEVLVSARVKLRARGEAAGAR